MLWLNVCLEKIKYLISSESVENLTYAALECRLAIERVCYERLKNAHDYISHDDIRKWQPGDVVKTLLREVDTHIASGFTVSMSPVSVSTEKELSQADVEALEYIHVGTQVGFDPQKFGKLWNALSSFLHVKVPNDKDEKIQPYGDPTKLRKKIDEAIEDLERLSKGTLISSGLGEAVSFTCHCGSLNRRRAALLKHGQIVSCINPECPERWVVESDGNEIGFRWKKISITCHGCSEPTDFPEKEVLNIGLNRTANFTCRCGATNHVAWRLMQAPPPTSS